MNSNVREGGDAAAQGKERLIGVAERPKTLRRSF